LVIAAITRPPSVLAATMPSRRGVSVGPGQTVFAVMP